MHPSDDQMDGVEFACDQILIAREFYSIMSSLDYKQSIIQFFIEAYKPTLT